MTRYENVPRPATMMLGVKGVTSELKLRLKVACAEEDCSYAEFIEKALDARDEERRNMPHPLARPKAAAR